MARVEWLQFLEGVGYGTYELMELRIPKENAELTHRSIDGIREAQHRLWLGDHGGALAEARKVIEALESLAPDKKLEALSRGTTLPARRPTPGLRRTSSKSLAQPSTTTAAAKFSRATKSPFVIRTVASLAGVVLDVAHEAEGA